MNHVLMPQIRLGLVAIATGLIMLGSMLSPLGELLEGTLVTHMIVQHFFFLAAGVLLAYGIDSSLLVASRLSTKASWAHAPDRESQSGGQQIWSLGIPCCRCLDCHLLHAR